MSACNSGDTNTASNTDSRATTISLNDMKHIGTVDQRYPSYNVEMAAVAGGQLWKPFHLMDSLPSLAAGSTYNVLKRTTRCTGNSPPLMGQHVMVGESGTVGYRSGAILSAGYSLKVNIFRCGAHGSQLQTSIDPLIVAAATIMRFKPLFPVR